MTTLGKVATKLIKMPWWTQIMMTVGPAIIGFAVTRMRNRHDSKRDLGANLERITKLMEDKTITEEEYDLLRQNLFEKYSR